VGPIDTDARLPPGHNCALARFRAEHGDEATKRLLSSPRYGRRYQKHSQTCRACALLITELFGDEEIPTRDWVEELGPEERAFLEQIETDPAQ